MHRLEFALNWKLPLSKNSTCWFRIKQRQVTGSVASAWCWSSGLLNGCSLAHPRAIGGWRQLDHLQHVAQPVSHVTYAR
jgi:hypothetical protein